jgi:Asp-tRNA(Asn)/Glu-tRNA(Gln) amidotransferase A subunit family amidase
MLQGLNTPFHGTPATVPELAAVKQAAQQAVPLDPRTRAAFMKAIEELRAQGATVLIDDSVLPESFARAAGRISTYPYVREGTDLFLKEFGSAEYRSAADYERVIGAPLGAPIIGTEPDNAQFGDVKIFQRLIETDRDAEANYYAPRRRALAMYLETMDRLSLDGYVYPAIQMPPVDETMAQEPPAGSTCWACPPSWSWMASMTAACHSAWSSPPVPSGTAICWAMPTPGSRRHTIVIRPRSLRAACCPMPVEAFSAPTHRAPDLPASRPRRRPPRSGR